MTSSEAASLPPAQGGAASGQARPDRRRPSGLVRAPRRAVHGVLLLDKPRGWSSNDALQKAKGMLRAEKAGHTGTLDPLATGLLPLCFGAATKFSQVSLDADKSYRATLRLGQRTSTGDLEGEVVAEAPVQVDPALIAAAIARHTGAIDQLPPMHSALKKDGKALYEYARAGIEVERTPRRVSIHAIDMVSWDDAAHTLVIDVRCSKGTYIRTLAEDIGAALGCGAHLAGLRRTASGALRLDSALTLEQLQAMSDDERLACLQSPDALLADWPVVNLGAADAARLLAGMRRRVALPDAPCVRVLGPDLALLGSAHITAGELIADRLLSPPEVAALAAARSAPAPRPAVAQAA